MSIEALKLALETLKRIDDAMPFPVAKLTMQQLRQAIQEASENGLYREGYRNGYEFGEAAGLRQAIEQKQEPVGTVAELFTQTAWERLDVRGSTKVYLTPPPQRTWVGLTNNDWNSTPYDTEFRAGAEWAEAKLKEKNT